MKDNYLVHYRTPGSKNGVRLYQYPDGTLTPLGELRYYKDTKNKSFYHDPKSKKHLVDPYGNHQRKELKKTIQRNGGQKTYKGYERAEFNNSEAYREPKLSGISIARDKFLRKPLYLDFTKIESSIAGDPDSTPEERYINSIVDANTEKIKNDAQFIGRGIKNIITKRQRERIIELEDKKFDEDINKAKDFLYETKDLINSPLAYLLNKYIFKT